MALQEKALESTHNIMSMTGAQTAKFARACHDLSDDAVMVLFAKTVMSSQGKEYAIRYGTPVADELIKHGLIFYTKEDHQIHLSQLVSHHMEACIAELVAGVGSTLLPQREPLTIRQLGHNEVKGRSYIEPKSFATKAERIMRHTVFVIDQKILQLASAQSANLSKQDRLVLACASSTVLPERFHYPISYDYRGRMYYRGGMLNPQGSDLNKALHQFGDKAEIGTGGFAAICLALADALGIKSPKDQAMREVLSRDIVGIARGEYLKEKKGTVSGFVAAGLALELVAIKQWTEAGNRKEDFRSGIIVHQDATCSGLQIGAAVTGHRETAVSTNCTASDKADVRNDVYQEVSDIISATDCELAKFTRKFGRAAVKTAVMTLGYGAGEEVLKASVLEYLSDQGITWKFDEASADTFLESVRSKCHATCVLKERLQHAAEMSAVKGETELSWVTADGFHAIQSKEEGNLLELGEFKMEVDLEFSSKLMATALPPNMVHSIDACQMRQAINILGKGTPVAAIHDSLGTRASDYWRAAHAVRTGFVRAQPRATVEGLLNKYDIQLEVLGNYSPEEAADSAYFWC